MLNLSWPTSHILPYPQKPNKTRVFTHKPDITLFLTNNKEQKTAHYNKLACHAIIDCNP